MIFVKKVKKIHQNFKNPVHIQLTCGNFRERLATVGAIFRNTVERTFYGRYVVNNFYSSS